MTKYRCVKEVLESDHGPFDLYYIEKYIGFKYLGYWQFVLSSRYENIAWQKLEASLESKKEIVSSKQL